MKFRTNLAYSKSNLQRTQQNIITEKVHIGRIYHNRIRLRLKFYIFSIIAASVFLSIFILSLVKRNEITAILNSTKKQLQIQQSENVLLRTQLEQKMSLQKVEEFARKNLGMMPLNNNQITYIHTGNGDKIEQNTQNSSEKSKNFFKQLINKLKKIINIES